MRETLTIETRGRGLYELTGEVDRLVARSESLQAQCHCFIMHTSASLGTLQSHSAQPRCTLSAPSCKAEGERQ